MDRDLNTVLDFEGFFTQEEDMKYQTFLKPRIIWIIPHCTDFQVHSKIHAQCYKIDMNLDTGETLNKKIRNAQLAQYNFILGKKKLICKAKK